MLAGYWGKNMNRALFQRRLRQLHLWLGLAIGAQVGLWLVSGLFMSWFPIEKVRGEHLRAEEVLPALSWSADYLGPAEALKIAGAGASTITAKRIGDEAVWEVSGLGRITLVDAETGEVISPLSEDRAVALADAAYSGEGKVASAERLVRAPQEYGGRVPVWRVDFAGGDDATFYVDASTGEVRAVRTGLWRAFDFMWGLHIMDWSSRENFNSWWLKMTASLAVLFFLAGLGLVIVRLADILRRSRR